MGIMGSEFLYKVPVLSGMAERKSSYVCTSLSQSSLATLIIIIHRV